MSSRRDDLARTVDVAEWRWLEPHARRGGLFLVAARLELLEVGMAMSADDVATVKGWLERGLLSRPTAGQLTAWGATPERRFQSLIVQPYVLVKELPLEMA